MPTFHYIATNQAGESVQGAIEAKNRLEAVDMIRHQGLMVTSIEESLSAKTASAARQTIGSVFGGVPLPALAVFFRQFETLVGAGVNLHQSLEALTRQTQNSQLRRVAIELADSVLSGEALCNGMSRYSHVFPPLTISLVRAGEEGGLLHRTLGQIADYLDKEVQLRGLVRKITFYPKMLVLAAIAIPGLTRIVVRSFAGESDFGGFLNSITFYYFAMPIIIAIALIFRLGSQSHEFCAAWDSIKLMIPGVGFSLRQLAMAKFGRALGALYAGGVPLPRAIGLAADACGNVAIQDAIKPAVLKIERGRTVTESLQTTNCFPPMVLNMLATGEHTGEMDKMLFSVAGYYEDEASAKAAMAATALGVFLVLLIAIYIGFMVISFYTSYFGQIMKPPDAMMLRF
jgi:type II secretory pathway component PulF